MARRKQPAPAARGWASLTWDDLHRWAGSRSVERGESYHRAGRVRDLARLGDDRLLAWVQGSELYAIEVQCLPQGDAALTSRCSCPVGFGRCKHAVAVVLAYLDARDNDHDVPAAAEDDDRRDILQRERVEAGKAKVDDDLVRAHLEAKPHKELVEYVLHLAEEYPQIRAELTEAVALISPDVIALVRQTRAEIHRRTAEEAWRRHWDDESHLPDYGGVRRRFERLLEVGAADQLLDLGRELFELGTQQVSQADDEGDTIFAIHECLKVVFQAVPTSSRSPRDQLLYAIDLLLADEYNLCEAAGDLLERDWPATAWSEVADALHRRLGPTPPQPLEDFSKRYGRDQVTDLLIQALTAARRTDEVLPLCEAEAPVTGSYQRLVERLREASRLADAERWAWEGVRQTEAHAPGIARDLRQTLRDLAARRGDWAAAAALRGDEFFQYPTVPLFAELLEAARRAGCEPAVRAAALGWLETGQRPAWPLPPLPVETPAGEARPRPEVLLDIALAEGRAADALRWFERVNADRQTSRWGPDLSRAAQVAEAVAPTQPERSITLYKELAEAHFGDSKPISYEPTGRYLSRLRELLAAQQRPGEWDEYVARLRKEYRRKRSLMEVLDHVEHPRISRKQ